MKILFAVKNNLPICWGKSQSLKEHAWYIWY